MPYRNARKLGIESNAPAEREPYSVSREEGQAGALQASFLQSRGLRREHRFLDIGCGHLRAGVKMIRLLERGNYYGIDSSPALIAAGRQQLADLRLSDRVPAGNLRATDSLNLYGFPLFDFAMAHDVFTRLPLSSLSRCLSAIRPNFYCGGRLFATFLSPAPSLLSLHWKHGVIKNAANDSFRFTAADIVAAAECVGWQTNWIGDWGHPSGQQIAEFIIAWQPDPLRVVRFAGIA